MDTDSRMSSWRAIEALRAGVPNRDAVKGLGCSQPGIEERFRLQLSALKEGIEQGSTAQGTLIAGDFGSGKSHLLEYLQHVALENGFVCSKVVISKETPLYDPAKVFNAAIQSAVLPDRAGSALVGIAGRLDYNSPAYASFYRWVNDPGNGLSARFAATVCVYEKGKGERNPEVSNRIIQFWSGSRIGTAELRGWLRELGELATYRIDKVPVRDLARQRYQFIPRLAIAAGYHGWVLLVDEVELIGRYSLRQRAKSYAEVARLLGGLEGAGVPGLTGVLTITREFESVVLDQRNDEEKIPARLNAAGGHEETLLSAQAERGMQLIRRSKVPLVNPVDTETTIQGICSKCRDLYARAYDWEPPQNCHWDRTRIIRQHIKRWINEWDLMRLYPQYTPVTEVAEMKPDLSEQPEIEASTGDEPSETDAPSHDS